MASLVYTLNETYFDGVDDYIDTNLHLFDGSKTQWVVVIDFTSDISLEDGTVILSMFDKRTSEGIAVDVTDEEPRGRLVGKYPVYAFYSAIAGNRHRLVIRRIDWSICFFSPDYSSIYEFGGNVSKSDTDKTLLIGAGTDLNENIYGFYKGTVNELKVYEGSMTDEEIISLAFLKPIITIGTPSTNKISSIVGHDQATVTFQSDMELQSWEARATIEGVETGHGVGLLVESGGSLSANENETVYVDDEELTNGDREYTISIFGQSTEGRWSDG